ncbi:tRNA methyltransferase 10 homolog A-like [Gordionus sp. m RMFG-2023]|uniref:tRNA methyltransferase 10 homolog A-like n=1 Tax=Gordionus sp. m RMFG-2023 TaxID=3053472 RepID=UPI0031FE0687
MNKKERRAKEKNKKKYRTAIPKEMGYTLNRKKLKLNKPESNALNIVIDFSYYDLMTEQELSKGLKQLQRCYAINRRSVNPVNLHATSFNDYLSQKLVQSANHLKWDVKFSENHFKDIFPVSDVIYLTSDSENEIHDVVSSNIYIIGGLVDHNRNKKHCYEQCKIMNINHGKLPIDKYLSIKKTKVLTIDHVFNILLTYHNCSNWLETFQKIIPKRKEAIPIIGDVKNENKFNDENE